MDCSGFISRKRDALMLRCFDASCFGLNHGSVFLCTHVFSVFRRSCWRIFCFLEGFPAVEQAGGGGGGRCSCGTAAFSLSHLPTSPFKKTIPLSSMPSLPFSASPQMPAPHARLLLTSFLLLCAPSLPCCQRCWIISSVLLRAALCCCVLVSASPFSGSSSSQ